jgi:hypothetical protein
MPRLSYVEPDKAPPEVQATYEKLKAARGRMPNFMKIFDHYPKGMHAALGLMGALRESKTGSEAASTRLSQGVPGQRVPLICPP